MSEPVQIDGNEVLKAVMDQRNAAHNDIATQRAIIVALEKQLAERDKRIAELEAKGTP